MTLQIYNRSQGAAELLLYSEIGPGGITAADVAGAIASVGSLRELTIGINSPGGEVADGLAIYQRIANLPYKVITRVDGLAASIASVIAMAGREVHCSDTGVMMIHDAWTITAGSAEDMLKSAEVLRTFDRQIVRTYAKKTGLPQREIEFMMAKESWFDSSEALALGFIDSIITAPSYATKASIAKGRYKNCPRHLESTYADDLRQQRNDAIRLRNSRLAQIEQRHNELKQRLGIR